MADHVAGSLVLANKDLLILIHGIRDTAGWLFNVKNAIQTAQLDVVIIPFGYFNAFKFLFPFHYRSKIIDYVESQLRKVIANHRQQYPQAKVSILAHSFGCHVAAEMLRRDPFMNLDKLVFCGSVLKSEFPSNILMRQTFIFINDCGTKDIWPVIASSSTWGFGSTGTFGFGINAIDRFHKCKHGDFANSTFYNNFWVPLFQNGFVNTGGFDAEKNAIVPTGIGPSKPNILMRPFLYLSFRWLLALVCLWGTWRLWPFVTSALASAGIELPQIVIRHDYKAPTVPTQSNYAVSPGDGGLNPANSNGSVQSELIQRMFIWKTWMKQASKSPAEAGTTMTTSKTVIVAKSNSAFDSHYNTFNCSVVIDAKWKIVEGCAFLAKDLNEASLVRPTYKELCYRQLDLITPIVKPEIDPNSLEIYKPNPGEYLLLVLRVESYGNNVPLPQEANGFGVVVTRR